jgi:hypothetical protein
MKKILLSIMILFSSTIVGQNNSELKNQEDNFNKAEQALRESNALEALQYYHQVSFPNLKTTLESKAKEKIDSLLPIYTKKESEKWIGVWKLVQLKTKDFDFKKIIISANLISFYNKESDSTPARTEKIKFTKYDPEYIIVNINSVEFENTEIWEFSVESTKNETRLFPKLKTDSDGTTFILLDERGIIRNDTERKKALAQEIRTYYIREK